MFAIFVAVGLLLMMLLLVAEWRSRKDKNISSDI